MRLVDPKGLSGMVWPIWICQHGSGQHDQIGLFILDHVVGLFWLVDHPACGRWESGFPAYPACDWNHEPWPPRDLRDIGGGKTHADIDHVQACGLELLDQFDGLFHSHSASHPISRREMSPRPRLRSLVMPFAQAGQRPSCSPTARPRSPLVPTMTTTSTAQTSHPSPITRIPKMPT